MKVNVHSEFGKLEAVITHTPGIEVEEMTPETAKRALYSDILNLSVARDEYRQMKGVLQKVATCYEVEELFGDILHDDDVKFDLVRTICAQEQAEMIQSDLLRCPPEELAKKLIQGVPIKRNNLTRYLSNERFSLFPLHNFFFTRDASMSFVHEVLIGNMANAVRNREALIMESIFTHNPKVQTQVIRTSTAEGINLEGGDFQVAREDILVIGTGVRTSTQAIDGIIEHIKQKKQGLKHILVQELPEAPESFIHLDMVFTFLAPDACMVYEPLILDSTRFHTIHIEVDNGKVKRIYEEQNLPKALAKLGMDMKPIACGGSKDIWTQEREQWHSGANFFAFSPGQIIGYERNVNTIEELNKNGFEVIPAVDVISGKAEIPTDSKCVVTIAGSELARGGGGARCMTMPVRRKGC
ncbi:MAG: arginine deiminase family protein [Mangrovibacterium sp.]